MIRLKEKNRLFKAKNHQDWINKRWYNQKIQLFMCIIIKNSTKITIKSSEKQVEYQNL